MGRADTSSQIVSHKRVVQRVRSKTTATTVVPDISSGDHYFYSALAGALTISNPIGAPKDGDRLVVRIKDNGTTRAITWGSQFRGGMVTATTANHTHYAVFHWNAAVTKWDCVLTADLT